MSAEIPFITTMSPPKSRKYRSFSPHYSERIEVLDRKLSKLGIRIKDEDTQKVTGEVFDEVTLLSLYKMINKKVISSVRGALSSGKEANVFLAYREDAAAAVKIYRIRTGNFTTMSDYIIGDPRFSSVKRTHKDLIFAWTKKEYSNLSRAQKAGIPSPKPYVFDRNILIMEFLGENGIPYPQMKQILPSTPEETYEEVLELIKDLYREAKLIHGDLSEYNILTGPDGLILIDMAQAVTPEHPKAYKFLFRDIQNMNRFFERKCSIRDPHEIFRDIVGQEFFKI
ncbi:MAG TPA: serine protein kinase RIO [Methanocorpusculum sp.]|nr:serine protein kinase RIO [Methanocorpusculum sp.]